MQHEARKTIAVIGAFVLLLYVTFGIFSLLTPLPEHPEIIRAKADIMREEATARLQLAWLQQVIFAGVAIIVSGVVVVLGGLWVASRYLKPPVYINPSQHRLYP